MMVGRSGELVSREDAFPRVIVNPHTTRGRPPGAHASLAIY